MAKAFEDQRRSPDIAALSFEERIGLIVDREAAERDTERWPRASSSPRCGRTPSSRMSTCEPHAASTAPCSRSSSPATGSTAPKGFDHQADRRRQKLDRLRARPQGLPDGRSVLSMAPRLFEALALARGDGRYGRMLRALARVQLPDPGRLGLSVLTEPEQRDVLEILEDRHQRASTIVTGQAPVRAMVRGHRQPPPSPTPSSTASSTTPTGSPMTGEGMRKLAARKHVLDDASKA